MELLAPPNPVMPNWVLQAAEATGRAPAEIMGQLGMEADAEPPSVLPGHSCSKGAVTPQVNGRERVPLAVSSGRANPRAAVTPRASSQSRKGRVRSPSPASNKGTTDRTTQRAIPRHQRPVGKASVP